MANEIAYFEGPVNDVAVISSAGVMITLVKDSHELVSESPGGKPTVVTLRPFDMLSGWGNIMPWGTSNDLPQQLVKLYNQDTIIPTTLGKISSMMLGRGIMVVRETIDGKGEEIDEPINDPHINAFINDKHTRKYLRKTAAHASWFFNAWPELIVSKNREKIAQINALNSPECRWGRMTDSGELPYVYVNANWPHVTAEDSLTKKVAAMNPDRYDLVNWVRKHRDYNLIYPIARDTPGHRFYSLPHHYSVVTSGWLAVHQSIPAFKDYLMKNQMNIKYHWKVDKEYWDLTFGETYKKGSIDVQRGIKKEWLRNMEKSLANVEKTGNSIVTERLWDGPNKAYRDMITVEVVKDNQLDGKYIDDNVEAGAQIFYAFDLDPVIAGFAGGAKQGQRSGGSDKREAYLIALQNLTPFREMLLEPLEFIAEYNGWKARYPDMKFKFRDTILTTLDTGAGTTKKLS